MHRLDFAVKHEFSSTTRGIEIDVTFDGGARVKAKIDTGAEFCVFQADVASMLELKLDEGEEREFSLANGGKFKAYGHSLRFWTLESEFDSVIYFSEEINRNVLGRNGWLNKVRVAFVDHDCLVYLSNHGG
ncbi:MAG: aspartyl protease family protein [Acidobacteria bacterium]|nr:aspartyl protease family protein [Acidobacteriota bacterium]